MTQQLLWEDPGSEAQGDPPAPPEPVSKLPPAVERALWRGDQIGTSASEVISTGFQALDAELPGGGWPCRSLTELLQAQAGILEWRLLGPTLRKVVQAGHSVVLIAPPRSPHLPGLRHIGIDERHLVWIKAEAPSERLWCTEQLIKSGGFGALLAWLPQARPEQIRRLQVCAQSCDGPVFLCRPLAARHEPSAAPLRIVPALHIDWQLSVHVFKRRGAAHDGLLTLESVPGGLQAIMTPRLMQPSRLLPNREVPADALGSPVALIEARRHAPSH